MISSELLLDQHTYLCLLLYCSKMIKIEEYYLENTRHLLFNTKIWWLVYLLYQNYVILIVMMKNKNCQIVQN